MKKGTIKIQIDYAQHELEEIESVLWAAVGLIDGSDDGEVVQACDMAFVILRELQRVRGNLQMLTRQIGEGGKA